MREAARQIEQHSRPRNVVVGTRMNRARGAPIARAVRSTEVDLLRSRLTAMAVESSDFKRDDIYTLFVATRIINFLKGLPLDGSTKLASLLSRPWHDSRTQIGMELLRRLCQTQRFYFWTSRGVVENRRFKVELFERVLTQAGEIACQNGAAISVGAKAS